MDWWFLFPVSSDLTSSRVSFSQLGPSWFLPSLRNVGCTHLKGSAGTHFSNRGDLKWNSWTAAALCRVFALTFLSLQTAKKQCGLRRMWGSILKYAVSERSSKMPLASAVQRTFPKVLVNLHGRKGTFVVNNSELFLGQPFYGRLSQVL